MKVCGSGLQDLMKALIIKNRLFVCVACICARGFDATCIAQPLSLGIQNYAGLTVTGSVAAVYEIQFVTDLSQASTATAWQALDFLQLPASPYVWVDKSAAASGVRFYRASPFVAGTNMVFIPPGTFGMGSPTNEVDRSVDEGPQTMVIISHGFWMGKYPVTQGE